MLNLKQPNLIICVLLFSYVERKLHFCTCQSCIAQKLIIFWFQDPHSVELRASKHKAYKRNYDLMPSSIISYYFKINGRKKIFKR